MPIARVIAAKMQTSLQALFALCTAFPDETQSLEHQHVTICVQTDRLTVSLCHCLYRAHLGLAVLVHSRQQ